MPSVEESGLAINFISQIATANTENGNCRADEVGLLGRIAACLVQPLVGSWRHILPAGWIRFSGGKLEDSVRFVVNRAAFYVTS
jgi:hypothetical protein